MNNDREEKADPKEDSPAVSKVIERNIRTLTDLRHKADDDRSLQSRAADTITAFSGHMIFVYLHIVWFGGWILFNSGLLGIRPFDKFPYQLLTMIVSLEAIFLSTFVLISQNRSTKAAELNADLNLQVVLLTERELTRVLQILDAMQSKMGIENDEESELADLEMDTKPEDVLVEINRLQQKPDKKGPLHEPKPGK